MYLYKQVKLNMNKEIRNTLQEIKGIGWFKAILLSAKIGLGYPFSCSLLNMYNYNILSNILDYVTLLEEKVKRYVNEKIQRYYSINTYRGIRNKGNLPVRGQRSRTNAKTKKSMKIYISYAHKYKKKYKGMAIEIKKKSIKKKMIGIAKEKSKHETEKPKIKLKYKALE